jgi:multidrug efflux pump subunit AcrA (membrane-fusion protein)
MDRTDSHNTVPVQPEFTEPEAEPGFFTDGEKGDGTVVPAWWLNAVQEEILNVIKAAGITPDKVSWGQLTAAVRSIIGTHASVTGAQTSADNAKTAADNARAAADAAQAAADTAQGKANDGYALALSSHNEAVDAMSRADLAFDKADSAEQEAGEVRNTLANINAGLTDLGEDNVRAMGQYREEPEPADLNEYYDSPNKILLTNSGSAPVPADLTFPVWAEIEVSETGSAVTQTIWDNTGSRIYTRCAEVNDSDPEEPIVTWSPWNSVAVPEVVRNVEVQVNPDGQPEGKYLVITFETEAGDRTVCIELSTLIGGAYTAGNNGITVSPDNRIGLKLDPDEANGLEIGEKGLKFTPPVPDSLIQSIAFDKSISADPIPAALEAGYSYAQIVYIGTDGTAAALTMAKQYASGSMTVTTDKTSIAGYDGIAVNFQADITGGTQATFNVHFTKE